MAQFPNSQTIFLESIIYCRKNHLIIRLSRAETGRGYNSVAIPYFFLPCEVTKKSFRELERGAASLDTFTGN
jgi:hypothetical protein